MMSLRLARPSVLVDIKRLDLGGITLEDAMVRIGALVRQSEIETDPIVRRYAPLLCDAARYVGHLATRNRGTLAGSIAHADPAAELPAAAMALGACVVASGPAGDRVISCAELADGYFTTVLEPAEIITEVLVPARGERGGSAWCEWAPRSGDFAEAGTGVAVETDTDGRIASVTAAACGVAPVPLPITPAFERAGVLGAASPQADLLRSVARRVEEDLSAGDEEKAELAGLLAARALATAMRRAARWN